MASIMPFQWRDGGMTEQRDRTGRTGSGLFLLTWPEEGKEREPCCLSKIDAPALKNRRSGKI